MRKRGTFAADISAVMPMGAQDHLVSLGVGERTSRRLLSEFGLPTIMAMTSAQLRAAGLTASSARAVHAACGLMRHATWDGRPRCASAEDAYNLMRYSMAFLDHEVFAVIAVNVRTDVLGIKIVGQGGVSGVEIHPREVFRAAILMNATGVVLGHNHPSGDPTPSHEDVELTRRMQSVGELVGIPVIDHVVVSRSGYRSIVEHLK